MRAYQEFVELGDWRRNELTHLKAILPEETSADFRVLARAATVLCYAHWEGYFNDMKTEMFRGVKAEVLRTNAPTAAFRMLFLRSEIDRLAASKVSDDQLVEFLCGFHVVDSQATKINITPAKSRSNLDSARLGVVFEIYGLGWWPLEKSRIFIDHMLARVRHQVAHGDDPRLKRSEVDGKINKTLLLLDELADFFSEVADKIGAR